MKPKDGPPEGLALNFPFRRDEPRVKAANEGLIGRVKSLKVGDVVTVRDATNFEVGP